MRNEPQNSPVAWLREPLVHFVALAALLFLVDSQSTQAQKERIVVSRQTIDFLIQQQEDLLLRELSPEERQETIDQFIEDEILYSEAYKRGLDRGDSRMRRNLILKMRGLLAGEVGEATDEELRAWYQQNRDRYVMAEAWSLEQVFFSDPSAVPDGLLGELRGGLDPATVGEDRLDMRRAFRAVTQRQLVGMLGPDAARAILAIDDDLWHGPIESAFGAHFVRVTGYRPSRDPAYEEVERYLAGDWMLAQTRERVDREITSLRDEYEIVIESEGPRR